MRFAACIPLLFFFKRPNIHFIKLLCVCFFWNVLTFFLVGLGLEYGAGVGPVSFIYQTCSFFGVLFCFLLLKEIPKQHQLAGMVLSFLGVSLLFIANNQLNENVTLSLLFILCAAMSWGFGITLIKKFNLSGDLPTNIWITAVASLPMSLMMLSRGGVELFVHSWQALTVEIMLGIFYAAFAANIFGNCLWFGLLNKYQSSVITPFMLLLPPLSSLISYLFLGETLSFLQMIAFLIIVLGISINQNLFSTLSLKLIFQRTLGKKWISTN